jgi:hypothetical protein
VFSGRIRSRNPSNLAAADPILRPRDQWHRRPAYKDLTFYEYVGVVWREWDTVFPRVSQTRRDADHSSPASAGAKNE